MNGLESFAIIIEYFNKEERNGRYIKLQTAKYQ
jgi:hypothetical protein